MTICCSALRGPLVGAGVGDVIDADHLEAPCGLRSKRLMRSSPDDDAASARAANATAETASDVAMRPILRAK
jgi:hypothetical protein